MENFLHFRKLWLGIGWSSVISIVLLSLIPPLSPSSTEDSFFGVFLNLPYSDKMEHVLAYFILMGWFAQIYHVPRQRINCLIGFILLGILLEILQGLGGIRIADWRDGLANSFGILLAWQLTKKRLGCLLIHLERRILFNVS